MQAKIGQCCSLFSSPEGRVYRPKDCERLVLYLKDLNLPRPDAYDTRVLGVCSIASASMFRIFVFENNIFISRAEASRAV